MREAVLSDRMRAVADMVTQGNRVCDVGCDHGFISIYLAAHGISPHVLAMDVRKGPLSAAKEHIGERHLEHIIETRLSDGLHNYKAGEADTLLCAGMGGRLMMRILSESKEKAVSFRELIFQPQSDVEQFRRFLRENGYRIVEEKMVEEDAKFYPMMRAVWSGGTETCGLCKPELKLCKLYDRYGFFLLQQKSEVLLAFLEREEAAYQKILAHLQAMGLEEEGRRQRYNEMERLLQESYMAKHMIKHKEG